MGRSTSGRYFEDTMRYLKIDVDSIKNSNDLRKKLAKARTPTGAPYATSQTLRVRQTLINTWERGGRQERPISQRRVVKFKRDIVSVKGRHKVVFRDNRGRFVKRP